MYKIPANTVFIGKNLVFVPECPSTNSLALEISQQSHASEGTLVITDRQTAGRGQRGNTWETEPGSNLTFSLILKPVFLATDRQFFLNVVTCLALKDYLGDKTTGTYIKWPNDILVHDKKISGILIENQLRSGQVNRSIVGIGFNLNQQHFNVPGATSLALETGISYDRETALSAILRCFEKYYLRLREGRYEELREEYLSSLYWRHTSRVFKSEGVLFEGVIESLDESGRLLVRTASGVRTFGVKEIRYIR